MSYVHGSFNIFVFIMFLYQGWLGLKIRGERKAKKPPTFTIIKRHRKTGPLLVLMSIAGFFVGATIVYLDEGEILEHPLHFFTGSVIVFSVLMTFLISRAIKGRELPWRNLHFMIGLIIICLYFIQVLIGIGILF